MISHAEFVEGYRTGRIGLTVDAPFAYMYAATHQLGWEWYFTGYLNLFFGEIFIAVFFVIMTLYLWDWWLLLGIPAGIAGIAAGSPNQNDYAKRVSVVLGVLGLAGLIVSCFGFEWRSPVFMVSGVFFVGFARRVLYHRICGRAFLHLLLTREDVYTDGIKGNFSSQKRK